MAARLDMFFRRTLKLIETLITLFSIIVFTKKNVLDISVFDKDLNVKYGRVKPSYVPYPEYCGRSK